MTLDPIPPPSSAGVPPLDMVDIIEERLAQRVVKLAEPLIREQTIQAVGLVVQMLRDTAVAGRNRPSVLSVFSRIGGALKGWKTAIFASILPAILPILFVAFQNLLDQLGQKDWTALGVAPIVGVVISAVVIALRNATNGPPAWKK